MTGPRRAFLLDAARLAAAASTGLGFTASTRAAGPAYPFSLGVASGSPLPHAVILWALLRKSGSASVERVGLLA